MISQDILAVWLLFSGRSMTLPRAQKPLRSLTEEDLQRQGLAEAAEGREPRGQPTAIADRNEWPVGHRARARAWRPCCGAFRRVQYFGSARRTQITFCARKRQTAVLCEKQAYGSLRKPLATG